MYYKAHIKQNYGKLTEPDRNLLMLQVALVLLLMLLACFFVCSLLLPAMVPKRWPMLAARELEVSTLYLSYVYFVKVARSHAVSRALAPSAVVGDFRSVESLF